MSKISKEVVIKSITRLKDSTNNKIWGLISLFACTNTEDGIRPNITYTIDSQKLAILLQDLFYFGNIHKEFNQNSSMYFRLSKKFQEEIKYYLPDKPILLADMAIFYFKDKIFNGELSYTAIVNEFKSLINLPDDILEEVFDCNIPDSNIQLEDDYTKVELLDNIKAALNINTDNTTLSFDSPFTVASHPSEFKRAPFVQTLYSGSAIQKLILLTDFNLDEFYPKIDSNETEISSPLNTIFFGAPGTGKSYKIENILAKIPEAHKYIVSFHPEFDYYSFVGGFKPISETQDDGKEAIKYKFVPQVFTNIYTNAWNDLSNTYYLAIEEINRGNCAEIFGDLFQLLDRNSNYNISPSIEMQQHLESKLVGDGIQGIEGGKMKLPPNLILLASMNTSDQSLFPMDSAFKRRWHWEYIPISYEEVNEDGTVNTSFFFEVKLDDATSFKWIEFIRKINEVIKSNPNLGMDKCIGNYFIKATQNEISISEFINKVIFYLWNDVFKDEENDVFPVGISYEEFFPISSKGRKNLISLLNNLSVSLNVSN